MQRLAWLGILLLLLGCPSSTPTETTGTLAVSLESTFADAEVTVIGADSVTTVRSSQDLTLKPGSYQILVKDVSANPQNGLIAQRFNATVTPASTVSVQAGETTQVSIVYSDSARDHSGQLWVLRNSEDNEAAAILVYPQDQLTAAINPQATPRVITSASLTNPWSMAFDDYGNLWVANFDADNVIMFSPEQLANDNPSPSLELTSTSVFDLNDVDDGPSSISFDDAGNLWVGTFDDKLLRFALADIQSSGNLVPEAILGRNFEHGLPETIVFDGSGNLWIALTNNETILKQNKADLDSSSDSLTPSKILMPSSEGEDLGAPTFDSTGNLWFGSYLCCEPNDGKVYTLSQAQQSTDLIAEQILNQTPEAQFLAFDSQDNLWLLNTSGNSLLQFTSDQLTAPGSPEANFQLTVGANFNQEMFLFY